jgi:hypothetical protein
MGKPRNSKSTCGQIIVLLHVSHNQTWKPFQTIELRLIITFLIRLTERAHRIPFVSPSNSRCSVFLSIAFVRFVCLSACPVDYKELFDILLLTFFGPREPQPIQIFPLGLNRTNKKTVKLPVKQLVISVLFTVHHYI